MKRPRTDRSLQTAAAIVVLAALALAAVSCGKKSGKAAQADRRGHEHAAIRVADRSRQHDGNGPIHARHEDANACGHQRAGHR